MATTREPRPDRPRPLQGVRVLELPGDVATRYVGRLFARCGAEVAMAGEPDDGRIGFGGVAGGVFGRWLDEAKDERDPDGRPDIVIAGQDRTSVVTGQEVAQRLGEATLLAVTWFDLAGPYADWPATDETILALSGLAYSFGEQEGPPTLAQGHAPQIIAGVTAFNAAVAALLAPRPRRPRRVDVNVFEAVMCLSELSAVAGLENEDIRSLRLGVNRFVPTYPCSSYRTADGWAGVTCLTPAQWSALCSATGQPERAADDRYATAVRRLFRADEVDAFLAPAIESRTTDEWVTEAKTRRIPITPMPRPGELPDDAHWKARDSFTNLDGIAVPGLPARMSFDGHARESRQPRAVAGPLSGVRVVDFTMGWAGPLATRFLSDLGAEVVKIESDGHPDWYRGWEENEAGDPPRHEVQSHFNTLNRNKLGIVVDLGTDAGRAVAERLVAGADVVIENFAAGVLDGLGLGRRVQRGLSPGVVTVTMAAFGSEGPLSGLRAYGSTVEQASGLPFVNGHEDWPPCVQHVAFGDPVAGLYAVAMVLVGLAGRERLGGADIDLSQVECLFQLAADAIVAAQVIGEPLPRLGSRRARAAPCCVVPGAEDDTWIAVAVHGEDAWRGLCAALGMASWAKDPELATPDGRNRRTDDIEAELARWAGARPAEAAAATLRDHGVASSPVQPAHTLGHDSQLVATGFWETMKRRYVGEHTLAAPPFRFDGERPRARRPAPTLGEHTDRVLGSVPEGATET